MLPIGNYPNRSGSIWGMSNLWYYPGEDFEGLKRDIEDFVSAFAETDTWLREHPPRLTWNLRGISFPPAATGADHPVVESMRRAVRVVGLPDRVKGATYVTDLSWYQAAGIPGFVFAPGSIDQAHSPNEYVEVDRLIDATKAIAVMLIDWSG